MKPFDNNELIRLMRRHLYEVTNDFGQGEEPYDGCEMNLWMILNDGDTEVLELDESEDTKRSCPSTRLFKVSSEYTWGVMYIRVQAE